MEIISYTGWTSHRFPLSFREVEAMMMERGALVGRLHHHTNWGT